MECKPKGVFGVEKPKMALKGIKVLKLASLILCIVLFCLLMTDIFEKYSKMLTSIGIIVEEYDKDEKKLPCFTLCPWKGFKNPGFHFKKEDFERKHRKGVESESEKRHKERKDQERRKKVEKERARERNKEC